MIVLCFVVRYFMSILIFAIILMGKRELVALLSFSSKCLVIVVLLFLAVLWVCLQFMIVVFHNHAQLLYLLRISQIPFIQTSKSEFRFRWRKIQINTIK